MSERRDVWAVPALDDESEEPLLGEIVEVEVRDLPWGRDTLPLAQAGHAANRAAAAGLFEAYRERLAPSTVRRQRAGIALFARYLQAAGVSITAEALFADPAAWRGVTWGLVGGFVRWLLGEGYATGTINVRLATVKSYARLAAQAGAIPTSEWGLIQTVKGYSQKESRHVDQRREVTRVGGKKAVPVRLSDAQATALKQQPETPQGRRDALLMCLLIDHGLRVGEVAELQVEDMDAHAGRMSFYRRKVDEVQTHKLTADTLRVVQRYLAQDAEPTGPLLRGSRKSGELVGTMSVRAIRRRVRVLGEAVGVERLSPHDCRHYWATYWAPRVPLKQLQKAGGWASPTMPLHYVEAAEIANEGMA